MTSEKDGQAVEQASDEAREVARYSQGSRLPGVWLPAHLFLCFVPFLAGFVIAGNTGSPIDAIALFGGIFGTYLLGERYRAESIAFTALAIKMLFPKRHDE